MHIFLTVFESYIVANIKKEKHHIKILEKVRNIFIPDENYKLLRERLAKANLPLIPPLEMYQGQLLFLNSCALVQKEEGIIQFHILQLTSASINEIKVINVII